MSSLFGQTLPHPLVTGVIISTIAGGFYAQYRATTRPDDGSIKGASTLCDFNSGLRLAHTYPIWSPYFYQRGYETLYNITHNALSSSVATRLLLGLVERSEPDPQLSVQCLDMDFDHPIGLAPGLTRTGEGLLGYLDLGFSFAECGSVSLYPQSGNPPRRLFDLPTLDLAGFSEVDYSQSHLDLFHPPKITDGADGRSKSENTWAGDLRQSLSKFPTFLHNMNNPNSGARVCIENLQKFHQTLPKRLEGRPIGVNMSLNSVLDAKHDPQNYNDFLTLYNLFSPYVNFVVINVNENEAFQPILPLNYDPRTPHQAVKANHHNANITTIESTMDEIQNNTSPIPLNPNAITPNSTNNVINNDENEINYLVDNFDVFSQFLEKEGVPLNKLEEANISVPKSMLAVPQYSIHYQISPIYAQFVESLLQLRDYGRSYPLAHKHTNTIQQQDERMEEYFIEKVASLSKQLRDLEKQHSQDFAQQLSRDGEDNSTTRTQGFDANIAISTIVDDLDRYNQRKTSLEAELLQIQEQQAEYMSKVTEARISYLKSIPTTNSKNETKASENIIIDAPTIYDVALDNAEQIYLSKMKALNLQSEEERYELAKEIITRQLDSNIYELQTALYEFKEMRLKNQQNPPTTLPHNNITTTTTTPYTPLMEPTRSKIEGYRVYDRSKLTTMGTMDAIDLSMAWSRRRRRQNKPKILFKLAADIEPRLAVLFSKFALLHGIDGLVVGGAASNRNAIFQPHYFEHHKKVLYEMQTRPTMSPLDYNFSDISSSLPPITDDELTQLKRQEEAGGKVVVPDKLQPGYLSGPILHKYTTKLIATIYKHTDGAIPIIGVGGVSSGKDIYDKMTAGATLVQLHSALYSDLTIVPKMRKELKRLIVDDLEEYQLKYGGQDGYSFMGIKSLGEVYQAIRKFDFDEKPKNIDGTTTELDNDARTAKNQQMMELTDLDRKRWKLNHIVGKNAAKLSFYDVDPYVQCYNDFVKVKEQYFEWQEKNQPQNATERKKSASYKPKLSKDETNQVCPGDKNTTTTLQTVTTTKNDVDIKLEDEFNYNTTNENIQTATLPNNGNDIEPLVEESQIEATIDPPKQSAGGIWYYLGY